MPERTIGHRTAAADGGHVYYEEFIPAFDTAPTVVMIHGGAHSGSCFQRTVSGEPGWAYRFAERGYRVVVPDWPGTGRSGYVAPHLLTGEAVVSGLAALLEQLDGSLILLTHSMSGCYGWRLLERFRDRVRAVVGVAPSPPGNIQPVPQIVRETDDEIEVQSRELRVPIPKGAPFVPDAAFVEKKLVGESRFFPRERLAEYGASLLPIPARLLLERQNVRGAQLRLSEDVRFDGTPVLVITGTEDIDHRPAVDGAIVTWLNEHGARAEFRYLGEIGITGNGHMLMLEKNSGEIADVIIAWLDGRR